MRKNMTDFLLSNKWPLLLISLIVLALAYIVTISAYNGSANNKNSTLTLQLEEINSLSGGLIKIKHLVETREKKLNSGRNKGVVTILDEILDSLKLQAGKLKPSDKKRVNDYTEENAELEINRLDLNEVVNLLHRIESSPSPMKVKSVNIQPVFDNNDLFIINLTVSLLSRS